MKKLGAIAVSIGLLLTAFWPLIGQAEPEVPDVIINELAWAGSSASSYDEWIELKNTTDTNIDISNWQITKDTSGDGTGESLMLTIPSDTILAQNYFLIANNGKDYDFDANPETEKLSVLNVDPDYIAIAVTLSNDKLKISLYDGDWQTDGKLIDTAGDGGKPFYPSNSGTKISMERNSIYGPGDLNSSWHEATAAVNLDPGVIDLATPRSLNSLPPEPAPIVNHIIPTQTESEINFILEEIVGENFATTGALQIKLEKGSNAIWATNWQVISPTTITQIKFDLHGAETGKWDIVVLNPDQQYGTLPDALEITEPEEEEENPPLDYSGNISISELYPRPASGSNDEFIELYNSGDTSVNLKGWKLDDQSPGGSAEYTIIQDTIIGPKQYLVFSKAQTHLYLNDSGDYARLLQPNGIVLDATPNYGNAPKGESYAKIDGNWRWTLRVTPGAANILEVEEMEEETESEEDSDPTSLQPNEIHIQLEYDDITNNSVQLMWKINLPGALGGLKLYQSDKKGHLGNQIAKPNLQPAEFAVQDLKPATTYYFTLVGAYNATDVRSNQIAITTSKGSAPETKGTAGDYKQILINEILPNPNAGDNEFIELFNSTNKVINLSGWKLRDASGKTYIISAIDLEILWIAEEEIPDEVVLEPGQFILLEYPVTHIRLNNSGGEEIQLLDSKDNLIDEVMYTSTAKQGYAYILAPNEQWFWSNETTPGEANDISFADIAGDSSFYLVDTGGKTSHWPTIGWLSGLFSAIMVTYLKRYGYHH